MNLSEKKLLIGMVHCLPLPGTFGATATIQQIVERAVSDAKCLEAAGFDAIIVENEDLCVEPHMTKVQLAGVSMVTLAVRNAVKIPVGLCFGCLNYEESLSVAKVSGCDFIRSPIFVDTVMNYNGVINPCSAKVIQYRKSIGAEHVKILADIQVKHYYMVDPTIDITVSAQWAQRQGADGVIVTGYTTGAETPQEDIVRVKRSISLPVAVGSGVTAENVLQKMEAADILIVGTTLRKDGKMSEPIDPDRAAQLMKAAGRVR